jgi:intracellular septation protein
MAVDYAGVLMMLAVSLVAWLGFHMKGASLVLASTWGLVLGSGAAVLASLIVRRKLAVMPAVYGSAALLFGGATLFYRDPSIVEMKTTVIDTGLAVLMLGGLAIGKSPIRMLMGQAVQLTDSGWRKLTLRFGLFFLAMAIGNELVRRQSHELWLAYRTAGSLLLTFVFAAFQAPLILRETVHPDPAGLHPPDSDVPD